MHGNRQAKDKAEERINSSHLVRLTHPGISSHQHHRQNSQSKTQRFQRHHLTNQYCGNGERKKGLKQLQLGDAGNATQAQPVFQAKKPKNMEPKLT